jgi:hypothetical protein
VVRKPEAFDSSCREAALVVSGLYAPANCAAPVVDRRMLTTTGALSLRRVDGRWIAAASREPFADRPWYARRRPADPQALSRLEGRAAPATDGDAAADESGDEPESTDAADE